MTGIRNTRWGRENLRLSQVWHEVKKPDQFWRIYQIHHADAIVEMILDGKGRETVRIVPVSDLRSRRWEQVA